MQKALHGHTQKEWEIAPANHHLEWDAVSSSAFEPTIMQTIRQLTQSIPYAHRDKQTLKHGLHISRHLGHASV